MHEIGVKNKTYLHNRNWSYEIFMQTYKSRLLSSLNIDLKLKCKAYEHCYSIVIIHFFMFQKSTLLNREKKTESIKKA
jgi:hypothetical protein